MSILANQFKQNIFTAILVCFNWLMISSQEIYLSSDLVFQQFNTYHNLSSDSTIKLFLDSEEILWIGTFGGFNAYDGYSIQQFKEYLYQGSGLEGRFVYSIAEDLFGNIWSGTYREGINVFNRKTGKIKNFNNAFLGIPEEEEYRFVSIIPLNKQQMFCATNRLLVNVSLNEDGSWLEHTVIDIELNENEQILDLTTYDNQIIIQTNQRILLKDQNGIKLLFLNEDIRSIKLKKDGILWLLTKDRIGTINLINGSQFLISYDKPKTIDSYFDFDIDYDHNLWVGTSHGILKLKIDDVLNVLDSQQIDVKNDVVVNVLVDHSNNVYFATKRNGFFKLGWERNNYNYISLPNAYREAHVNKGLEDRSGLYWLVAKKGVFIYDSRSKDYISINGKDLINLGDYHVTDIYEDQEGLVWLSTDNGIAKFDREDKKFVFFGTHLGKGTRFTHHLEMDNNSNIWYATPKGIGKLSKNTNRVEHYDFGVNSCIYLDPENRLWAHFFRKGLYCFDISTGKPVEIKSYAKHFARYPAREMISDTLGRLWYSCENGIYVLDTKKEEVINHLHRDNLLATDDIWQPVQNSEGNFWIKQRLSEAICINPYTFEVVNTSPSWLKVMSEGAGFAGPNYIDRNGNVFTDGVGGFFVYKIDNFKINLSPPKVLLTNIAVNGEEVFNNPIGSTTQNLEKLKYSNNSITFNFKGTHGDNPNKIRYAYRLLGQKEEWTYTSTRSPINYSGLLPNTYQFEVKAANKNLVWSEPIALASFQILPPWWKTNLAYLIYLLLLSGIIYTIYKIQLNRRLAVAETKKLKEVDDFKNRFFANITHEFRTPLTVILGLTDKVEKKTATILKRNANQLLKLVNELLEIGKIESNFSKLNMTTQDMVQFSKYCLESLESLALEKAIQLKFHSNKDEILMSFDAEKMQLILNNLLSNAIKFTPSQGHIELTIAEMNKHVELEVKDSGIGIPKDSLEKIFDRYYRVENKAVQSDSIGLGLALTRELVKLMNGTIVAQNNNEGGACFVVSLPISITEEIDLSESVLHSVNDLAMSNEDDQNIVLVIEDNQDVLNYTTSILKDSYQIVTASNGKLGYEKALEIIPDLIVSDVMMPIMDGFEACEKLKTDFRTNHIPIIMLTAKADIGSKISGLQYGADAYLSKPFNRGELLAHIDNLIKIREKLKEKYSQTILGNDELKPKVSNKFLDDIKSILLEHLSDDTFGIHEICSEIGVSRTQFHRKLKALTGLSASIFIREIRLQQAYAMLQDTALNISEVAYSVGFNDPNYFSNLFHEKYNFTPTQVKTREH